MRWLCACALGAAAIVTGSWLAWPAAAAPPPAPTAADRCPDCRFRGAGSCAAAACHNGNGPKGSKGSEYTTWVAYDPHARAYEILYGEHSLRIETNLKRLASTKQAHPEADTLCLNCHVRPGIEPLAEQPTKAGQRDALLYADGVGCESCHGPAEKWLTEHYRPGWKNKSAEEKARLGMANTRDLLARGEMCVTCHVGKGDVDVNHDLIAAGHPRLAFEYAAFLANVPKHWTEKGDNARPDFEARAWAVGQALSAGAALELLAHRADAANKKPWPEFAEYDCFACHHDLLDQEWRRGPAQTRIRLGAPAWGSWYFPMVPEALAEPAPRVLLDELSALREEMARPFPNQKQVAAHAAAAADKLPPRGGKLEQSAWGEGELTRKLVRIAADERNLSRQNWDGAAQVFLALAALQSARAQVDPGRRDPQLNSHIRALGLQLQFPPDPKPNTRYDSPHDRGPEQYQKALEMIRQDLRK
jgi:hypothetical protein